MLFIVSMRYSNTLNTLKTLKNRVLTVKVSLTELVTLHGIKKKIFILVIKIIMTFKPFLKNL